MIGVAIINKNRIAWRYMWHDNGIYTYFFCSFEVFSTMRCPRRLRCVCRAADGAEAVKRKAGLQLYGSETDGCISKVDHANDHIFIFVLSSDEGARCTAFCQGAHRFHQSCSNRRRGNMPQLPCDCVSCLDGNFGSSCHWCWAGNSCKITSVDVPSRKLLSSRPLTLFLSSLLLGNDLLGT